MYSPGVHEELCLNMPRPEIIPRPNRRHSKRDPGNNRHDFHTQTAEELHIKLTKPYTVCISFLYEHRCTLLENFTDDATA